MDSDCGEFSTCQKTANGRQCVPLYPKKIRKELKYRRVENAQIKKRKKAASASHLRYRLSILGADLTSLALLLVSYHNHNDRSGFDPLKKAFLGGSNVLGQFNLTTLFIELGYYTVVPIIHIVNDNFFSAGLSFGLRILTVQTVKTVAEAALLFLFLGFPAHYLAVIPGLVLSMNLIDYFFLAWRPAVSKSVSQQKDGHTHVRPFVSVTEKETTAGIFFAW